ncbi:ribosome maturation factor RimM [Paracoccaceae bacterium GXU_MW_L88]
MAKDLVCVGAIVGAFGVKGETRIKSFCAEPEDIASYGPLKDQAGKSYTLSALRPIKGGFAVRLSGVPSKEAADAMRGTRLYAPRDALPSLPDDEFYHADLIGLEVYDTGGVKLGKVKAVHNHGAGDFLEVAAHGASPRLLPFTQAAVPTVDLAAGRIIADPPEETGEPEGDPVQSDE